MNDDCKSKVLAVYVQENGIIRTYFGGEIIGRLVNGIDFDGLSEYDITQMEDK